MKILDGIQRIIRVLEGLQASIRQNADALAENTDAIQRTQQSPTQHQPTIDVDLDIPPPVVAYCQSKIEQEPREELTRRVKLTVEFVGLLAAIVLAVFTYRTLGEVRRQVAAAQQQAELMRKQLESTDRPWVTLDVLPVSPLLVYKGVARAGFSFTLRNVGRSPAQNIWINARLLNSLNHRESIKVQKTVCPNTVTKGVGGQVIFPDKVLTQVIQLDMSMQSPEIPKTSRIAVPVVVGCVDYTFGSGAEQHQTGVMLDLRMNNLLGIYLDQAPIPAESLKLIQWPEGSLFAN